MLIEQEVTTLYKEVHIARQMTGGHPRRHRLLTTEMQKYQACNDFLRTCSVIVTNELVNYNEIEVFIGEEMN